MAEPMKDDVYKYDTEYKYAIYDGISKKIQYEAFFGTKDNREMLKWIVDKYKTEIMLSASTLEEELEKYNKIAELKYGKLDGD